MLDAARPAPVGVLVPPANPTVEPEMRTLLAGSATPYTARLPYLPALSLAERLARYPQAASQAVRSFGTIPLRAVLFACTGSSYLHGADADMEFCAELSAAHDTAFVTSAGAVLGDIRRLGLSSLTLVSPYPDWLSDLSAAFWASTGVEVRAVVHVQGDGTIYDLSPQAVLDVVARHCDPRRHGPLLLTGTGMPTAEAVEALAPSWPHPVLSGAVCAARWLRAVTSAQSGTPGVHA